MRPNRRLNERAAAAQAHDAEVASSQASAVGPYVALGTAHRGELSVSYAAGAWTWELCDGDQCVGRIFARGHEIGGASGSWRITASRGRSPIMFEPRSPGGPVATYYRRRLARGGRLSVSTGQAYALHQNVLTGTFRLTDDDGVELLRIEPHGGKTRPAFTVTLHRTAENEATTLLATLAACYALLFLEPKGVTAAGYA